MNLFFGVEQDGYYTEVLAENKTEDEIRLGTAVWQAERTVTEEPFLAGVKEHGSCVFTYKAAKRFKGKVYMRLMLDGWNDGDFFIVSGKTIENPSRVYRYSEDIEKGIMGVYLKNSSRGILFSAPRETSRGFTGLLFNVKRPDSEKRRGIFLLAEVPGEREIDFSDSSTLFSADTKQGIFKKGDSIELPFTVYDFPCGSMEDLISVYKEL